MSNYPMCCPDGTECPQNEYIDELETEQQQRDELIFKLATIRAEQESKIAELKAAEKKAWMDGFSSGCNVGDFYTKGTEDDLWELYKEQENE